MLTQEAQVITFIVEVNLLEEEVDVDQTTQLETIQHVNFVTGMSML